MKDLFDETIERYGGESQGDTDIEHEIDDPDDDEEEEV